MADVFNRTTGEFIPSAHTPNFSVVDWVINPDLTAVLGQPIRFWFITGATNPEGQEELGIVSVGEQATIDAALAATRLTAEKDGAKSSLDVERVLVALVELLPDEFNILRTLHSLPDRTFAGLRTAIRAKIDAGT